MNTKERLESVLKHEGKCISVIDCISCELYKYCSLIALKADSNFSIGMNKLNFIYKNRYEAAVNKYKELYSIEELMELLL